MFSAWTNSLGSNVVKIGRLYRKKDNFGIHISDFLKKYDDKINLHDKKTAKKLIQIINYIVFYM